jgi:hypothetical protein
MAVTPDQDVLSFVGKVDGKWRLTRVRNWLDKNPPEQTIDVPGLTRPSFGGLDLLATPDGNFAICIARGTESVVSVIDLRVFRVLMTIHQSGSPAYFTDPAGRLVTAEVVDRDPSRLPVVRNQAGRWTDTRLAFFTLPDLVPSGTCQFRETLEGNNFVPHDKDCGPTLKDLLDALSPKRGHSLGGLYPERNSPATGSTCQLGVISGDYQFRMEHCAEYGRRVWNGNGTYRNAHINVLYTNGESIAGVIGETTRDTVHEAFAAQNGRDYLLVMEGGTKLKIYEMKDTRP